MVPCFHEPLLQFGAHRQCVGAHEKEIDSETTEKRLPINEEITGSNALIWLDAQGGINAVHSDVGKQEINRQHMH